MDTSKANLQSFFSVQRQYQIPLYQRPYVWEEEKQWQPLWEDICEVAEDYMAKLADKKDQISPHFMGAVVLKQLKTNTSDMIDRRLVIDGQQRITTLQILLKSVLDLFAEKKLEKHDAKIKVALQKLICNEDAPEDEGEIYPSCQKIHPSRKDVEAFLLVAKADSPKSLRKLIAEEEKGKSLTDNRIIDAYTFFYEQVDDWMEEDDLKSAIQLQALKQTLLKGLELVIIDLDEKEKEQVIFETLNARGTPLLQLDLVKNFLYYKAETDGDDVRVLNANYWNFFEEEKNSRFWEKTVRQGRLHRPASDVFLHHYLTIKKQGEVDAVELFSEYKNLLEGSMKTEECLKELVAYAKIYKKFCEYTADTYEGVFFERLADLDFTTTYPLLMRIFYELPGPENQIRRDCILRCVESYLVRRAVCRLTPKNYNNLFTEILKKVNEGNEFSAKAVCKILKAYGAETNKWPNDAEFRAAWTSMPLYKTLNRAKMRMALKALSDALFTEKSEGAAVSDHKKLTIEHILPQSWEEHWPLNLDGLNSEQKIQAQNEREVLLHTIGNLTLTTGKLNPALSNASWSDKRPELQRHSAITMNRLLVQLDAWNEQSIRKRSEELFDLALELWPYKFE